MPRRNAAKQQEISTGRGSSCWSTDAILGLVLFAWCTSWFMAPVIPVIIVTVIAVPVTFFGRNKLRGHLHTLKIKRQWNRHVPYAKLRGIRPVPTGEILDLRIQPGGCVADIEKRAGPAKELAAIMKVGNVRVKRDAEDGSRAQLVLARANPFIPGEQIPWPHINTPKLSLHDPALIGKCDEGHQVHVALLERCMLVCGVQKSGKSTLLHLLTAVGALDPLAQIWLFDGKEEVEFAPWERVAKRVIGSDPTRALNAINQLKRLMKERQRQLREDKLRHVPRNHPDYPPYLIIIDEATAYLDELPQTQARRFESDLRAIVQQGRNAGFAPIVSTQKPQHSLIDTALRDLLTLRWMGSATTQVFSDMGLGGKWAKLGYDASMIPRGQFGVGYLLAEDGLPELMKSYYLTDDDIRSIAQRSVIKHERPSPPKPARVTAANTPDPDDPDTDDDDPDTDDDDS
jgi:S-DNA-T family DNA segregation ATPase FtsK/SpoIIIE